MVAVAVDRFRVSVVVVGALHGLPPLPPPPPSTTATPGEAAAAAPQRQQSAAGDADEVRDVAENLVVAAARLVAGAARQRGAGTVALALGPHALRLALLRLRELSGDDDEAKVDHEERTDLENIRIPAAEYTTFKFFYSTFVFAILL